ncbi:Cellulosome-anchoring protein precursor [compost metagenome]
MFTKPRFHKVFAIVLISMLLLGVLTPGGLQRVQAADGGGTVTSPEFNGDGTVTVSTYSPKSEMYINGNFTNWSTFRPMSLTGTILVDGVQQNVFSYNLSTQDFNNTGGVVQYKYIPQASWSGDYTDFLNASPKVSGNSAVYFLKLALNQKQLQPGQSTPAEAFRYLSDGNKADLTGSVNWTSSEPAFVTVSNGTVLVAPNAPLGTVTITGVYQGVSATATLEVVESLPVPKVRSVANLTDLNDRLMIGQPTPEITGEVEVEDITNGAGKGNNLIAQLGYRFETDPDYTWVNAVYKDDVGNSDRFSAQFTPDRAGKWYYAMRFSLDNGLTWDQKILGYKVNKFFDEQTIVKPFDVMLTWTQDAKTTQTITWKTDSNVSESYVQYAEKSNEGSFPGVNTSVMAEEKGYKTQYVNVSASVHTATLTGLKPGTAYVYRVGTGTNWSDTATFTTEASIAAPFQFLIFGDSQSGRQEESDYAKWGETVNAAYQANPEAKFIINNGDLVEKGSYEHWHKWFEGAEGVIENIPEMPVTGNHEYYSTYGVNEQADNFKMQFNLPQNGPDRLKGLVYSYDYGDVHISVLNSQNTEANTDQTEKMGDILAEQAAWLDQDLMSTDKKWKIVFYHKASYYSRSSRAADAEKVKLAFQPVIDKYHVDLVFGAHDHTITRTYPINNNNFVDNTTKGTVYYITGRSGNKNYSDPFKQVWDAYYKNDTDDTNYLTVNVNGDKLTVKAIEKNGNVLDEYTIDKTAGTPSVELPNIPIAKAENLSALSNEQNAGTKTDDITAEVNSQNVTNYTGRGVHIQAQLGYKLSEDTQYTWVDAVYAQDNGNNDVYRANFVPDKAGNWEYVMRFSGDGGNTWTSTEAKTVKAISNNTGEEGPGPALLTGLSVDQGTISPAFSSSVFNYRVDVANTVSSLGIFLNTGDSSPVLSVTGATYASVTGSVYEYHAANLAVGPNPIEIKLSNENGSTNSYTLIVNRAQSSNADLSRLTLSNATISPVFGAGITSYSASVANGVASTSVTATASDSNATITVNNTAVVIGQASESIALSVGSNVITIAVKAQDGTAKSYTVTVTREAAPSSVSGGQPTATAPTTPTTPTTGTKPEPAKINPFQSKVINEEAVIQAIRESIAATKNTSISFSDIAQHWSRNEIVLAVKLRIINGYQNGTFRPDASVTRAEFAAMVCRAFGLEAGQGSASFRDTTTNWASDYIRTLAAKGIINGYSDGSFRPNAAISRAEIVTILARVLDLGQLATGNSASFTDVGNDHWAKNVIGEAYKAQLIQGVTPSAFKPDNQATRAEAITVLLRALKSDSSIKELIEGM